MTKFLNAHEKFIQQSLEDSSVDLDWLGHNHRDWIGFLQQERLAHLLVTLMVAFLLVVFFTLSLFFKTLPFLIVFLILAVLLLFYIAHYFKLENTVQKWYALYDELANRKKS